MQTIVGGALPNIPWEDKPAGCTDVVWRSAKNPIIGRYAFEGSNSIFNSAVMPYGDGFIGIFRSDLKTRQQTLHLGRSKDGVNWEIEKELIDFICDDPEIATHGEGYDPRLCKIDDTYYITWCNQYHGPTIGIASTKDFKTFKQLENAFLPFNRNGVLFPRKIGGQYLMLSRPSDPGHTPFGDIFISESPDMIHWGKHRFVMGSKDGQNWESCKIGAGPIPIETSEGWLLFYHGVLNSCNGFTYSFGAALLDLEQPWKVKYRCKPYLLSPIELYETVGDVPNVTFPCAALTDTATGRIAIYYGCADSVVGLAYAQADELLDYIKRNA